MRFLKLAVILLGFATQAIANDISIHLNGSHLGYILPSGSFSLEDSGWYESDFWGNESLRCDLVRDQKVKISDNRIQLSSTNINVSKKSMSAPFEYVDTFKVKIIFEDNSYKLDSLICSCESEVRGKCQEEIYRLPLSVPKNKPEWSEATFGD